jgi:protein involved in temperature-dependent protein secretion
MREALEAAIHASRSGQIDRALASVRAMVRAHPRDMDARMTLGYLLHQAGDHEQAIHQLERVASARNL